MTKNLFSVPIFFIVFRETIEAAIIVATLLGLAKQIAYDTRGTTYTSPSTDDDSNKERDVAPAIPPVEESLRMRRLARKLKIQASYPSSSHFKMLTFCSDLRRRRSGDCDCTGHWCSVRDFSLP
jgi:high-affinity Fe2+/Pb2+ permease